MRRWGIGLLAVVVLGGSACSGDEEARVSRQERRQFHIVMESKLKQLDRGMTRLGVAAAPTDSVYAQDVEKLKSSGRTLRDKLDAMDAASNEDWAAMRDSVESYYHGVRSQYADLIKRTGAPTVARVDSTTASAVAHP